MENPGNFRSIGLRELCVVQEATNTLRVSIPILRSAMNDPCPYTVHLWGSLTTLKIEFKHSLSSEEAESYYRE